MFYNSIDTDIANDRLFIDEYDFIPKEMYDSLFREEESSFDDLEEESSYDDFEFDFLEDD